MPATQELKKQFQTSLDQLRSELGKIDGKITEEIRRQEKKHPNKRLLRANLELKITNIRQKKAASLLQALIAVEEINSALLELEVRLAQIEADAAAAQAVHDKALAEAEKKNAEARADAEKAAANAKAEAALQAANERATSNQNANAAQAEAAKQAALADGLQAQGAAKAAALAAAGNAKADADKKAADAKTKADLEAAQKSAEADLRAAQAKQKADKKKAEQTSIDELIKKLREAIITLKDSATSVDEMRKMKEEIEKEIPTDGPAPGALPPGPVKPPAVITGVGG